jgi:hypothetical protein
LFHDSPLGDETFARAEALLDELRPESPLRHRLETELTEIRKIKRPKQPKQSAQRAKS